MSTYDSDPNRRYELDEDTGAGNWVAGIIGVLVIVGLIAWGVWGSWGPGGAGRTQTADNTPAATTGMGASPSVPARPMAPAPAPGAAH
jgi:hypothetical protein